MGDRNRPLDQSDQAKLDALVAQLASATGSSKQEIRDQIAAALSSPAPQKVRTEEEVEQEIRETITEALYRYRDSYMKEEIEGLHDEIDRAGVWFAKRPVIVPGEIAGDLTTIAEFVRVVAVNFRNCDKEEDAAVRVLEWLKSITPKERK